MGGCSIIFLSVEFLKLGIVFFFFLKRGINIGLDEC